MENKRTITIVSLRKCWEHPSGEYRIYRLETVGEDGKRETISTYSDDFTEGWQGTVSVYLNKRGELMCKPHTRSLTYYTTGDSHYNDFDLDWSHKE